MTASAPAAAAFAVPAGPQPAWPRWALALAFAFFAGCPVFANLVGTYVADGQSFAVTAGIGVLFLALAVAAAFRLGVPRRACDLGGPLSVLVAIGAAFWCHWVLINLISPSPQEAMHYQVLQCGVWLLAPLTIATIWRQWLDPWLVIRLLVVIYAVFIVAMAARWALGLGFYQSGRWHAGHSLEAIRCGRYAAMALWTCALASLCPAKVVPTWLKVVALAVLPVALLMLVAANARGPWLALAVTIAATCLPLARVLALRIGRDARLLAGLLVLVAGVGAFVALQVSSVESDFNRLFTLTHDGGSAEGRVTLVDDHLQLLAQTPAAVLSGCGYGHGYFYPHNVLIEALANGGVVSLCLLLAMILATFHTWLARCPAGDLPCLLAAGCFILSLIGSEVSGSIAGDLTWYFPLLLVLSLARARPPAPAGSPAPAPLVLDPGWAA
jgi:O-antigen ligase